jgi:hypothetical protein
MTYGLKSDRFQALRRNIRTGNTLFERAKKNLSPVKRRGRLLE